ncbi:MAG TPA: S8 family serine peptidase [Egicoccus sp.]|nr:S8 family serine peptidase [Egicoccus sp.]
MRLLALALLLLGLAVPAAAAPPAAVTGLGPPTPVPLSAARVQQIHAAVDATLDAAIVPRDPRGSARLATTGSSETYDDFCDDAPAAGDDLRRAVITTFPSTGMMRLDIETCGVITGDALLGGVSLVLATPAGRSYLVTIRQAAGSFVGSVVETSGADPLGTVRHTGTGWLADDGHGAAYEFPLSALDGPDVFFFWLEARDVSAQIIDRMPEAEEPTVGVWPGSCQRRDVFRATVQAHPDRLGLALASARAAGLTASAVNPVTSTFDVTLGGSDQAGRLAALPGIAAVTGSEVFEAGAGPAATDQSAAAADGEAWWRTEVGASAAIGRASGAGITIGLIDNGIDGTRPELGDRVAGGRDVRRSRDLEPGENSDRGGHGTLVAGVAAGASDAVTGIAPEATLRPYQVFDFAGCATANAIAAAIDAAIADRVDVLNLSLGSPGTTSAVLAAALERARQAGVLLVAAAGNDALVDQPSVPAEHPATIGVGATGPAGVLAPYSNRADWVELVAPGGAGTTPSTGILSLGERDGYAVVNGTSFSAPIVAGAAALHLQMSGATAETVRADLATTARDLGVHGRDPEFGFGIVDVSALLAQAAATLPVTVRDISSACADARPDRFGDVATTDVHAPGIDCVAHYAVAGGFADGTYRPSAPVDRGQMATFVANTILASGGDLPAPSGAFDDVAGTAHETAIRRLAAAGIVTGVTPAGYQPAATVTRAQMATFLVRAIEYRTGVPLAGGPGGFADVVGSAHELNIGKAAAAGLTGGATQDSYRPEGLVTRGQMGSFLARTLAYLVDTGVATAR